METLVIVVTIQVGTEQVEGIQKSLDHWHHTAEAAYGAKIRLNGVGKQGGN